MENKNEHLYKRREGFEKQILKHLEHKLLLKNILEYHKHDISAIEGESWTFKKSVDTHDEQIEFIREQIKGINDFIEKEDLKKLTTIKISGTSQPLILHNDGTSSMIVDITK